MWTFPGNLRMQGDSGVILGQLLEELKEKATPKFKEAAAEARRGAHRRAQGLARGRRQDGGQQGQARRDQPALPVRRAEQAAQGRRHRAATKASATPAPACCSSSGRSPNTCVRSGGGGLGWSGGMALGAKLAAPDKMVVQVVGDGGFYFGGPSSVFSVAQQYKLPILVMLLDNTGWSAVKESTLRVFPEGEAKEDGPVPGQPDARRRVLQDRRGVRRLRREGHQSGRRAGGARAGGRRRCAAAGRRSCTCG